MERVRWCARDGPSLKIKSCREAPRFCQQIGRKGADDLSPGSRPEQALASEIRRTSSLPAFPVTWSNLRRSNADMIPNCAERRRYGERASVGFVESAVNTVAGKCFGKRQQIQQMQWSKGSAHLMLQARARTLDGTLREKLEQ